MNRGHVPVRQCVGCRTRLEKRGLIRFVRRHDGWVIDRGGREPGRGAYLCSPECALAVKKNKRYRALSGIAAVAFN